MRLLLRILPMLVVCLALAATAKVAHSQQSAPDTDSTVTVTGKVPAPYRDPYTYFPPDLLLRSTLSGGVYHNEFFGFSLKLPANLVIEDLAVTEERNKGIAIRAEPPKSPLTAQTVHVLGPIDLLVARGGVGNPQHSSLPFMCICMDVSLSKTDQLNLDTVKRSLDSGKSIREQHGIHLVSEPSELTIKGRQFIREDFKEPLNGETIWHTFLRTGIHGGMLTFEFRAGSEAEMEQLVESVKSFALDSIAH